MTNVPMTISEFADFESGDGAAVVEVHGIWWRRVRPLFYRPLDPLEALPANLVAAREITRLGGIQYLVAELGASNSTMNLLVFEDPSNYRLSELSHQIRSGIRKAASRYTILPIQETQVLADDGYPVYLSFQQRTKYTYLRERTQKAEFQRWAEHVAGNPKVIVLGAYRSGVLEAVSVYFLVRRTLFYATFFGNLEALRSNVSDLMLHEIRTAATHAPEAQCIFISMAGTTPGLDTFFLRRGARMQMRPALFEVHPLTQFMLKHFMKEQYSRLLGISTPERAARRAM
jgi:hypothetical protein